MVAERSMVVHTGPLVAIVTPVYNGAAYLAECIESVLAQTYMSWDYTIVNNCSSDDTLKIAEHYARQDERIHVHTNDVFLDIIGNHNNAFRLISPDSKYCKVVSADDWLLPECITKMVQLAETHPSAGVVGSYQLSGGGDKWYVRTDGLPYYSSLVPGHDICRSQLLGTKDVFGNPTSNLYRSDLVRRTSAFYPNATAEADISACFECLRDTDFAFVHQVLSCERIHEVRITTTSQDRNAYLSSKIGDLTTYGNLYLSGAECEQRLKALLDEYYRFLGTSALNRRDREFWNYHRSRLQDLGYPLDRLRLGSATCMKLMDLLLNPKQTVERVLRRPGVRAKGALRDRVRQHGPSTPQAQVHSAGETSAVSR